MEKFTLYSLISKTVSLCDSNTQRKNFFNKIYHFCEQNHDLNSEDFYNLLRDKKIFSLRRDYNHSTNPILSTRGERLYDGLETFSFQIDNSITIEKLKEVRERELSFIRSFDYGK